jgi:ribose 5-phosphate isomerase RpiB
MELGADPAGFRAKENIKKWLKIAGYRVNDVGTRSGESGLKTQFLSAF